VACPPSRSVLPGCDDLGFAVAHSDTDAAPHGRRSPARSIGHGEVDPHYQLTPRLLVPAIREWIMRLQGNSWRGRARCGCVNGRPNGNTVHQTCASINQEFFWFVIAVPRRIRTAEQQALLRALSSTTDFGGVRGCWLWPRSLPGCSTRWRWNAPNRGARARGRWSRQSECPTRSATLRHSKPRTCPG